MKAWMGIVIFVCVLVLAFAVAIRILRSPMPPVTPASTVAAITNIHFLDSYKSGVHTIKGTATVPTACTTLTASSTVVTQADASSTPTIRIDLSAPLDTGMCLELPTDMPFTLTAKAPSDVQVDIFANGTLATSTFL